MEVPTSPGGYVRSPRRAPTPLWSTSRPVDIQQVDGGLDGRVLSMQSAYPLPMLDT